MISDEVCMAFEISKFTLQYYRFEKMIPYTLRGNKSDCPYGI